MAFLMEKTDSSKLDYGARMPLGDHLNELRLRLIFALLGFIAALGICLFFGRQTTAAFCWPLITELMKHDLTPQVYYTDVSDGFMVFIRISLISATVISSPWLLFQLWLFVSAGLYPNERRTVKRYLPLSLGLLLAGLAMVYFLVLPWTLAFLIEFGSDIPLPRELGRPASVAVSDDTQPLQIPIFKGDPASPADNTIWFNTLDGRLKFYRDGQIRVIPFGPSNLAAPMITLPNYISMVLGMLLTFGLSFQLPLVVAALAKVRIVSIKLLKSSRRYVYFIIAILAAIITPGDVMTVTVALMVPLVLLYELGILLAVRVTREQT